MTDADADVVVVGGGPAGLAAAAAFAGRGRSVVLLEKGAESRLRVGETLGAEVAGYLRALGATPALAVLEGQAAFTGVRSAWGGAALAERSAVLHPLGNGWHVDRARFDAALAGWARAAGVRVHGEVGTCRIAREDAGFRVTSAAGVSVRAARAVDASGRGAPASAGLDGRAWLSLDRQVALLGRLTGPTRAPGPGLLLEAAEAGYWYSAPLADGTLVAVFVTDGDLLVAAGADEADRFVRLLAASRHTADRLAGATLVEAPRPFRSDSGRLCPPRGAGWLAVGDAALATDPLGGNGVARALRDALEAVEDTAAVTADARAARRFAEYLESRAAYYAAEARWPESPFWARRRPLGPDGRPVDWRAVSVGLAPDTRLRWRRTPPPAAEAWLPRAPLRALAQLLDTPRPAHEAMGALRQVCPLGDRRLLVALQWLIATGALAIDDPV